MKNFTPDERAADANIGNTRGRAKPDTGILWGICRRTYKSRGNRGESEAARGAAGETAERRKIRNGLKIWTECHARGIGKTLSTIENPKVLTVFSVGTLGFSIVLSVGGGKRRRISRPLTGLYDKGVCLLLEYDITLSAL